MGGNRASNREEARQALIEFKERWRKIYPEVVKRWEENFNSLTTFMDYPQKIRRFIYTTNQLERLMKEIKRRSKVIEVFSEPEAVYKVVYLGITEYERKVQSEKLIRIPGSHF